MQKNFNLLIKDFIFVLVIGNDLSQSKMFPLFFLLLGISTISLAINGVC